MTDEININTLCLALLLADIQDVISMHQGNKDSAEKHLTEMKRIGYSHLIKRFENEADFKRHIEDLKPESAIRLAHIIRSQVKENPGTWNATMNWLLHSLCEVSGLKMEALFNNVEGTDLDVAVKPYIEKSSFNETANSGTKKTRKKI